VAGRAGEGWAAGEAKGAALGGAAGGGWEGAPAAGGWGKAEGVQAVEGKGSRPHTGPPLPQLVAAWQARLQGGGEAKGGELKQPWL